MRILANGITSISQLNEVMELIGTQFTTDRSTEDQIIEYSGDYGIYDVKISLYYDEIQTIEIEVL